ncbi:MAG: hypothetical protein GY786_21700 [Proteobacteria bacterium]|nr:hypothetical protein [Pseudomonadota bacterium]
MLKITEGQKAILLLLEEEQCQQVKSIAKAIKYDQEGTQQAINNLVHLGYIDFDYLITEFSLDIWIQLSDEGVKAAETVLSKEILLTPEFDDIRLDLHLDVLSKKDFSGIESNSYLIEVCCLLWNMVATTKFEISKNKERAIHITDDLVGANASEWIKNAISGKIDDMISFMILQERKNKKVVSSNCYI